jgi:uncharacterized protein
MIPFDWSTYHGNLDWLPQRTIYLTVHGSHAYGTNVPGSDLDLRGVCIPPKPYYLGSLHTFEQAEQHEPDLNIYELKKLLRLASDCNPNVIEVLYTDPSFVRVCTPLGEKLLEHRDLFLSRKAKSTFCGYAISQLHRIKKHYAWHTNPPKAPPTRAEYGLPERTLIPADQLAAANATIGKKLDEWSIRFLDEGDPALRIEVLNKMKDHLAEIQVSMDENLWIGAARTLGFDDNFIAILDRERRYTSKQREWEQFGEWKKHRNPKRAALEAKFGYDTKHAYHLVRLVRMCREILTYGKVLVLRPDWEDLLEIRHGSWPIERLIEWTEKEDKDLWDVQRASPLPKEPDRQRIDALCIEMIEQSFRNEKVDNFFRESTA